VLATDNRTIIAFMIEGTYFGEIGLLLMKKRSCSIQAKTVCVFFTIEKEDLI
jgi:CRP-like cAMP-binding protein